MENIMSAVLASIAAALITTHFNRVKDKNIKESLQVEKRPIRTNVDWLFVLGWTLACFFLESIFLTIGDDWFGVSIALTQTIVLSFKIKENGEWIWWWFISSAVAWFIIWYTSWNVFSLRTIYAGPIYGITAGVFQWIVIRNRYWDSEWWILASLLGWSLGYVIADGLSAALGLSLAGLITGFSIEKIFRYPKKYSI